jgi:ATP-dependent exoDNAse (exonuclease V) beta subunit
MIDQFTKQDFESYLQSNHPSFESLGLIDSEEVYNITLDNQVSVTVRSSIKSNGLSADVGKDSIRCWLISKNGAPLGSKISKWTTRQEGWQKRLDKNILQFLKWRMLAGDCKECGLPKGIFKAKTEKNKGRPFAKCQEHNGFTWLDKDIDVGNVYFSEKSHGNPASKNEQEITMAHSSTSSEYKRNENKDSLQELPKGPNPAQQSAIEADVNANLRVLAGPGSGKTYVIERRYKYLVESGICPSSILVCTFSKNMADEMGKRILETCSQANLEQISTIHAFCYRVLCKWHPDSRYFKWQVPKDWQVKKCLEDAIGLIWQEKEKPSAKEVFDYICSSKYFGLTTDDSYLWFVDQLGQQHSEWLYEIRAKFDAWLNRNRFLTFSDMLFHVEQRLKLDEQWRTMLQERFSHVIIDEAQDTSFQAIRVLVTVSLEPGKNTVYGEEE